MTERSRVTRRRFIGSAAAGAAALSLGPSPVLAASKKANQIRFATIGAGGKGRSDTSSTINAGGHLVALCDVDEHRAAEVYKAHPDVPKFTDYREMLDKMDKEIDAVVISTPDHVHAVAAVDAIRRGKHVYVQKPLARTFEECQVLMEAARKHGVVAQMGNQGHAGSGLKLWQKMMDDGAFGEIQEVHTWSNRPVWPQGMTQLPAEDSVPSTLDWPLWLGPQEMRPFSKAYVPFKWRGWWDFGTGAMGDMACHNMDPAFWILNLGLPTKIKAQASAPAGVAYPDWSIIEYTFGPTSVCPNGVKMTWYDGKKLPPKPANSHPHLKIGTNGCMVVGSKMTAMGGSHAAAPYAVALGQQEYGQAVKDVEGHWRNELKQLKGDNHYGQWLDAIKANDPKQAKSNFDYAAPFTQAILLGCIALRYPGEELHWDNTQRRFTNHSDANQWLKFQPGKGYDLSY